jgi:nitroreductase/FMN reductase [NAD(P)H]
VPLRRIGLATTATFGAAAILLGAPDAAVVPLLVAATALSAAWNGLSFVAAAELAGLGTCPISQIRNHPQAVSDLLGLPDWVFPVAGMCVGWPAEEGAVVPRLPLAATVHTDRFDDRDVRRLVESYDKRRRYRTQRDPERFGTAAEYGWSEDKARQYAKPERADFGAYVRRRGFRLD